MYNNGKADDKADGKAGDNVPIKVEPCEIIYNHSTDTSDTNEYYLILEKLKFLE